MTDDVEGVIPNPPNQVPCAVNSGRVWFGRFLFLALSACDAAESRPAGESGDAGDAGTSVAPGSNTKTEATGDSTPDAGRTPRANDDADIEPARPPTRSNDAGTSADETETGSDSASNDSDTETSSDSASNDSETESPSADSGASSAPESSSTDSDNGSDSATDSNSTTSTTDWGTSDTQVDAAARDLEPGVLPTAIQYSFEDSDSYDFQSTPIGDPAADRVLIIATHSASNDLVVHERVLVGGVEATKVASVGEDVEPSAPTALFALPFTEGTEADIRMELSTTVVRGAIVVYAAYGLDSPVPHDSTSVTSMETSTLSLDVSQPGIVVAGLAMATSSSGMASLGNVEPLYHELLLEGTPTLIVGGYDKVLPGTVHIEVAATVNNYNYRAVAAVFQ